MIHDDEHHDERYEDGDNSTGTVGDYDSEWSPMPSERELRDTRDFYAGKRFHREFDPSYHAG